MPVLPVQRGWQWALAMPKDQNPFFDENGSCAHGGNKQSGKVWYLTGVFNDTGRAERNCTIPEDKFIFFPILNLECDTLTPPTIGGSAAELSACSHSYRMTNLVAEVDGIAIPNLDRYLVESPLFTFTLPKNNVLNLPAGTGKAVSTGAWLMLPPLEEGQHTIHFGGSFPDFPFTLDITYHLKVK